MARDAASFEPSLDRLKRCYVFMGDDPIAMSDALAKLRRAAVGEEAGADYESFDPAPGVAAAVAGAAAMPALFSPRRLVALRNALRLGRREFEGEMEALEKALPALPEYACVALVCDPDPDADYMAQQRMDAVAKRLAKAAGKDGEVVSCSAPTKAPGLEKLGELAAEKGVRIGKAALSALWEASRQDFRIARANLDKLREYAGTDEVGVEDVRAAVEPEGVENVFRLVDAVAAGNVRDALTQLDLLFAADDEQKVALQTVLPQLSRHLRLLWQAHWMLKERKPDQWASAKGDPRLPSAYNLADTVSRQAFLAGIYARRAESTTPERLARSFEAVRKAEAALKGHGTGASAADILGRLLVELCEISRAEGRAPVGRR